LPDSRGERQEGDGGKALLIADGDPAVEIGVVQTFPLKGSETYQVTAKVRAVADAKVEFVGQQGGYGNLVVLKHQGTYSTAYGHLSRFGKGLRRGAGVSQGQVIGYVGSTGLASGPHLHYEFRVNNVQKNPLALKLPTSYPLDTHAKAQFASKAQPLVRNLTLLRGTNLASLD